MSENFVTEIREWRGVKGLVAAEVLTDDNGASGYTTGTPFPIAAVAEISKVRDSTSEAHYYNDIPAVVITGDSADTVTISVSMIPLEVNAKITCQTYDDTTGTLIEHERSTKYFAIGYITEDNLGNNILVWRLKGTFNVADQTNSTRNDGTDANGQELVYTGVQTIHEFAKNGKGARAVNVEEEKGLVNTTNFFASVQTPDTIAPAGSYILDIVNAAGCTAQVTSGGVTLNRGDTITTGQVLTITWTHPEDEYTYVCDCISGGVTTSIAYPSGTYTVGNDNVVVTPHRVST